MVPAVRCPLPIHSAGICQECEQGSHFGPSPTSQCTSSKLEKVQHHTAPRLVSKRLRYGIVLQYCKKSCTTTEHYSSTSVLRTATTKDYGAVLRILCLLVSSWTTPGLALLHRTNHQSPLTTFSVNPYSTEYRVVPNPYCISTLSAD